MNRYLAKSKLFFLLTILIVSIDIHPAYSADLIEVYNLAERNDPQFRQVAANKRAVLEQRPQAISQLLPQVGLSANTYRNSQDSTISSGFGAGGEFDYNSHGYNVNLTQPLFRWDRYLRLKQADNLIKQADAELGLAQQELIIRVAESYFEILAAIDSLQFAQAEKRSLSRQLEQSKQRFEVGLTAITDVQEAQAGYDQAVAQEIQAGNAVDNAREALREITGSYFTELPELTDSMPLLTPEPADIDEWTNTAVKESLSVLAALEAVDNAREEIGIQRSGHLPTLDVVTQYGYSTTGGRFGDSSTRSTAIGLELNVPLFQGGFVSSKTREAQQRLQEQMERLEQARRKAHRDTREAYLGVISGISQIKALNQAVISSETALQATEAGYEVGTRTAVDVVTSERTTYQAKRDYARARYNYILDTLRLKLASGLLSTDDLIQVNQWLN